MPGQALEALQPVLDAARDELVPGLARLDDEQVALALDPARADEHDRARHALVGDHDVRAARQQQRGPLTAHRRDQLLLGVGLDQPLRGAAEAQRRQGRQPHPRSHLIG